MSAISYILDINDTPASPEVLDAIQQIEVEDHAYMADMLRMRIAIGVKDGCGNWNVLDDDVFSRLANVKLIMTIGSGPSEMLISAYVIEMNASISNQPGQSVLDIIAMDPTVLMNLEVKVRPWPNMADSNIATSIFGEYGFIPIVDQTQPSRDEVNVTTIQRDTDMKFLTELAARNGYEVYVEVNPQTGITEGHFHSPNLEQTRQEVLSVNMGEYTNVNSLNPRYDMLRPTKAKTIGIDVETQSDQEARIENQSQEVLGTRDSLSGDRIRSVLLSQSGLYQTGELQNYAQAIADQSSWAITADGELNTVAYGGVLRAKRPVEVRGAGQQFSGTYYVERVHHVISGDSYRQSFTLRRNALELTGQERFIPTNSLTL
jgi:phage protein D